MASCSPAWVGAGSAACLWFCKSSSMYPVTAPAALPRQRTAARCTLGGPLSPASCLTADRTSSAALSPCCNQLWPSTATGNMLPEP